GACRGRDKGGASTERVTLQASLRAIGQDAIADALDRLPPADAARLEAELAATDLDLIARLVRELVLVDRPPLGGEVTPAEPGDVVHLPRTPEEFEAERRARAEGERMLAEGRVAAVLLAGGQGSRLGFEGPKGNFPFAPITGRTLF